MDQLLLPITSGVPGVSAFTRHSMIDLFKTLARNCRGNYLWRLGCDIIPTE